MKRMFANVVALCLAIAVVSSRAHADGEVVRGPGTAAPYRTHPLSPGPEYGPDGTDPCKRLAGAQWGADYVAGVDAYGRAVAPADLDDSRGDDSAPVVTFDIPVPHGHGISRRHGEMTAGTVAVDTATGLVDIDGRALNPANARGLRELCLGR